MAFAEDYVPVAERIVQFREKYPDGCLRPVDPLKPFTVLEVAGSTYVAFTAAAYRTPDDPCPGIGCAWEPVPGLTNFTRNSELMNCETSAWGRAIISVGAADAKKGIASQEDVQIRRAEDDYYQSNPQPPVPGFRSSLMAATEGLTDTERVLLREWLVEQKLPDRPSKMTAEEAGRVCEWLIHGMPKVEEVPA